MAKICTFNPVRPIRVTREQKRRLIVSLLNWPDLDQTAPALRDIDSVAENQTGHEMKKTPRNAIRALGPAAALLLVALQSSLAQDVRVPCSALSRNSHGGWEVLAPVMLQIEGRLLGPIVGTIFEPGTTTTNGIKINEVLDRACQEAHTVNVSGIPK